MGVIGSEHARSLVQADFSPDFLGKLVRLIYECYQRSLELASRDNFEPHVKKQIAGYARWGFMESFMRQLADSNSTGGIQGEEASNASRGWKHYVVRTPSCRLTIVPSRTKGKPRKALYRLRYAKANQTKQPDLFLSSKPHTNEEGLYIILNFGSYKAKAERPDWILLQIPDTEMENLIDQIDLKSEFPDLVSQLEPTAGDESVEEVAPKPKRKIKVSAE